MVARVRYLERVHTKIILCHGLLNKIFFIDNELFTADNNAGIDVIFPERSWWVDKLLCWPATIDQISVYISQAKNVYSDRV